MHIQIILDIEKYLGHYTDQTGYFFISKKGSHLARDNECTMESTPGSGYVYIYLRATVTIRELSDF